MCLKQESGWQTFQEKNSYDLPGEKSHKCWKNEFEPSENHKATVQ